MQYKYEITGKSHILTRAKKIGRAIAVAIPKEMEGWLDRDVLLVLEGEIESFKKVKK